ncbi:transposase [Legionella gresilensis]|uniref:transposase n=1 Tax=Legionella gresilensis TaxID=91823 RepID=UPI001040F62F
MLISLKETLKFFLPTYSPELNPQELVNKDVKANCNHTRVLKTMEELTINICYYLTKIQFNPDKIISFYKKKP